MAWSVGEPLLDWVSNKEDNVSKDATTVTVVSDDEFTQTKGVHCNPFCDGMGELFRPNVGVSYVKRMR